MRRGFTRSTLGEVGGFHVKRAVAFKSREKPKQKIVCEFPSPFPTRLLAQPLFHMSAATWAEYFPKVSLNELYYMFNKGIMNYST